MQIAIMFLFLNFLVEITFDHPENQQSDETKILIKEMGVIKKMNQLLFSIICLSLCFSCSENAALFQEGLLLKEVNDSVSKTNSCKLMFYYSKQNPDQLVLTLQNSYSDEYLPSKVVYDYYIGASNKKINVKEYSMKNLQDSVLFTLTTDELASIQRDKERAEAVIALIVKGEIESVYNSMDTSVTNSVGRAIFKAQFDSMTFGKAEFGGFQLFSPYVGIRFTDNKNNQLFLIYDLNSNEDKIFGVTVK